MGSLALATTPAASGSATATPAHEHRLGLPDGRELVLAGVPRVMGIVNVTPDSFSDGGLHLDPERAADHALLLLEQGADLVDLGAESTRPGGGVYGAGAATVPAAEEIRRLLPALRRLRRATAAPISVDTRKGAVARAALEEGADLVNDVSALQDPEMAEVLAHHRVPVVLMHSRGELGTMQQGIRFERVVEEVCTELEARLELAAARGIDRSRTVVDPGIGFGKTAAQNLELLRRLAVLHRLGRPVLVGASRKSFLAHLGGAPPERRRGDPPEHRLEASLAAGAWAASAGAQLVRVHDVAATVRFLRAWGAIAVAGDQGAAA